MEEPRLFEPSGVIERVQFELVRWQSGWELVIRTHYQGARDLSIPEVYSELTWAEAMDVVYSAGL